MTSNFEFASRGCSGWGYGAYQEQGSADREAMCKRVYWALLSCLWSPKQDSPSPLKSSTVEIIRQIDQQMERRVGILFRSLLQREQRVSPSATHAYKLLYYRSRHLDQCSAISGSKFVLVIEGLLNPPPEVGRACTFNRSHSVAS